MTFTLTFTCIMLAFSMQYTIIDLIKLNEKITKNLLQNPISEEEEAHEDGKSSGLIVENIIALNPLILLELPKFSCKNDCFNYRFNAIDSINEPPENNS